LQLAGIQVKVKTKVIIDLYKGMLLKQKELINAVVSLPSTIFKKEIRQYNKAIHVVM